MTIKINPVAKPRMTQRDRWAKRPVVERYYAFCDQLRAAYGPLLDGEVELVFGIPMPKSWSKKKRLKMVSMPHRQRPDIDNLIKAVFDALCKEDKFIFSVKASKFWVEEGFITIEAKSILKGKHDRK